MKQYLTNLTQALFGRNCYRTELDELRSHYEQAADNVKSLTDEYYKCTEKLEAAEIRLAETERAFDEERRGYQTLTENLRDRIRYYEEYTAECQKEITSLRRQLLAAMRDASDKDRKAEG